MRLGAWSKVMEFELNHLYNVDDIAGGAQFIKNKYAGRICIQIQRLLLIPLNVK